MLNKTEHNIMLPKNSWNFPLAYRRIIFHWDSKEYSHLLPQATQSIQPWIPPPFHPHPLPLPKASLRLCSLHRNHRHLALRTPKENGLKIPRLLNFEERELGKSVTLSLSKTAGGKKILILDTEGNVASKLGETDVTPNYRFWMSVLLT